MAYETGTATGVSDLLDKLETFLTTDSDLVAAGQEWTVMLSESYTGISDFTNYRLCLKGTGFGGNDAIYCNLELDTNDVESPVYGNLWLQGADSFNASLSNNAQSGAIPYPVKMFSEVSTSFTYHFIANGRRVIIITSHDSDTIFESAYLGLILPYSTNKDYLYPLFIGGSTNSLITAITNTSYSHSCFWDPSIAGYGYSTVESLDRYSPAKFKSGSYWKGFQNSYYSGAANYYTAWRNLLPFSTNSTTHTTDVPIYQSITLTEDSEVALFPIVLIDRYNNNEVIGELDGIYAVTGGVVVGDTLTYGGYDYLIIQNAFRTSNYNHAAIRIQETP